MNSRLTFGEHLKQFALSIDFLDQGHYDLVQRQVVKYLQIQLGATQVAFFEPCPVDGRLGIRTVWSAPSFQIHQTLRDDEDRYRRQLALALGKRRDLWVVSQSDEGLSEKNRGIDERGREAVTELPPFEPAPGAPPSKTAISTLTRDSQGTVNGVFLVELRARVRPTKTLRREVQLLADAVGLLHATDCATREQRKGTANAIERLMDLMPDSELDTGPRPFLFVASSSDADANVVNAIKDVLTEFEDRVFAVPWYEMHRPGNINLQLVEQIRKAQYGICYLSERDKKDGSKFVDNPNVLIEAGMLHMVTRTVGLTDTGWIPIREVCDQHTPFDLENQRMVFVPRNQKGELAGEDFKGELRQKLESLLRGDEESWGDEGIRKRRSAPNGKDADPSRTSGGPAAASRPTPTH